MLSDTQVKNLKPSAKQRVISDNTGGGLTLVIQRSRTDGNAAAKTWIWRGRVGGKIRTVKIGRAEVMKATVARERAMKITHSVLEGRDAHAEHKQAKAIAKRTDTPTTDAITVSQAWRLYMRAEGDSRKTSGEKERLYQKDAEPTIGSKPIASITSDDLARLVNNVAKRAPVTGDRLQANLSRFFRWSSSSRGRLDTGLTSNPMQGVEKPWGQSVKRDRTLCAKELRWLLMALQEARDAPRAASATRDTAESRWANALEVLLRTGQRKSDILDLCDNEIDYEQHTAVIPRQRFKSGVDHSIWLAPRVEALLKTVERPDADTDLKNTTMLFQRMGSHSYNLTRIRERMEKIAGRPIPNWTPHDLRRTFASTLADMVDGDERPVTSTDEIKKVLGHTLQGAISHYLHGQSLRLKRRVMKVWSDHLDGLLPERG